ncbi:MAG: RNA polymerase sigma factor [Cyclobacteriaceae bacterium]
MAAAHHQSEQDIRNDEQWIIAAKKDPADFSYLYDKYFEQIFNFIFRRIDEENITADLTSQTFLKALQNIKKYQNKGLPFSAWLYRIASNEVNKHYRRIKRRYVFSLEENLIKNLIASEDDGGESDEKFQKVIKTLEDLETNDVIILELRFFEERSFKDIAYILDITESSAKMRTYRAIEKLKKKIYIK